MTLVKTFANTSAAAVAVAWRKLPRVEKISLSSKLDGERHSEAQQQDFASAKSARTQLCRNETTAAVSERDNLRLVPAFVTQVLAQAMPGAGADSSSALLAYRSRASQIAPVYDRGA